MIGDRTCETCGAFVARWPNGPDAPRFPHSREDVYAQSGKVEPCPAGKSNPARA